MSASTEPGAALRAVPGSFRDPRGHVYDRGGAIVRALDEQGLDDARAVLSSDFFRKALAAGAVVGTELASDGEQAAMVELGWAGALRHERVPVISHPYEWSFSMLRDAALLQLELVEGALHEGIACKDGSSYNVQFVGSSPRFIDVGSFQPGSDEGWPGYRQFCQLFLFPLLLEAYLGTSFAPWLRGSIDGIALDDAARLLGGRARWRRGVLTHVTAQAAVARRAGRSGPGRPSRVAGSVSGDQIALGLVSRLRRLVERLPAPEGESTWSDYGPRGHYERAALIAKEDLVRRVVAVAAPRTVVDLGCNDGRFAELVAETGARVVAVDADRQVVDRLYRRIRGRGLPILPLVADLADPSPALGWALRERASLPERLQADVVLSLALIHHLIIGRSIPTAELLDLLAGLGPIHVLEVPHRDDPMVRRLLAAKPAGIHDDYRRSVLRQRIHERFEILEEVELPGGTRTMFHLRAR